ncbi:aminotransferase class III-fold pyridoxal phosphate-dependent enzyme [Streptomyces rugosispiralis]|uniref:Aminotransferase class III-fold pyridoxal phosphate-dependent enzyme n=1 Tax=Streptomyces rugosispiralis TaxID=2967341 RepID=A0ABT1UNH7_9ACTN|nr:aminotransferase class III-fold pyridoxal phosphate-dependent enzyme [Streptomyces rugosispiralis]MCQ8186693.1 aminotransferase class III-fold pyridoxal phosphate-dependent enzyme [Streptomyces rugosispiralis]
MLPVVSHATGVYVYDQEGLEYLDGCSGAINVNLGHSVPEVTSRMHEQIDRACYAYRTQFRSQPLMRLTELLVELAPGDLRHVEYCNSGSEAIEMALRLATLIHARAYRPFKCTVLTEEPSYHGMTAGALGASGHPLRRRDLTPLLANQATVSRVRPKHGSLRAGVHDWEAAIERIGPANLSAVLIEPVGGASSGAVPTAPETLRRLRELADQHQFLLIADEVMSGLGRTGRWFGCEHAGITPDVIVLGKGISAGFAPIAALLASDKVADAAGQPLGTVLFGHTMAGTPLSAAAGLAVVEYLKAHDVPAHAAEAGERLHELLQGLRQRHRVISDVRGVGMQMALGLHSDASRFPGTSLDLVEAARREGLLLYPSGVTPALESVMVAPPLVSTDAELDELAVRLDRALTRLSPAAPVADASQLLSSGC